MKTLNPYLSFSGQCRAALEFYRACFQGEIVTSQTFEEAHVEVGEAYKQYLMHAEFKADGVHLMASDSPPGRPVTAGNNVSLSLQLSDVEEQTAIFNALARGGVVEMPLADTFWGARFGMVTDQFGIHWMLNCAHA